MSRIMIFASLFWMTTVAHASEDALCGATGFAEELQDSFGGVWTAAPAQRKYSNITLKRGVISSEADAEPQDAFMWFPAASDPLAADAEPQDAMMWFPAASDPLAKDAEPQDAMMYFLGSSTPPPKDRADSQPDGILKASLASSSMVGKGARQAIDDILGGSQAGEKSSDAYFVKVDRETTTQNREGGKRTVVTCVAADASRSQATIDWSGPPADGYAFDLDGQGYLVLDLASL